MLYPDKTIAAGVPKPPSPAWSSPKLRSTDSVARNTRGYLKAKLTSQTHTFMLPICPYSSSRPITHPFSSLSLSSPC